MNTFKLLCKLSLFSTLVFSTQAFAHSDHADPADLPVLESHGNISAAVGEKPSYLGAASVRLLESPIDLAVNYGEAYFITNATTNSEKYVNLGFSSLNVFHYADAFRAFRMAAVEDNSSIFAQVGIVFSALENEPSQSALYFTSLAFQQMDLIATQRALTAKETAWMQLAKAFQVYRTGTSAGISGTVPSFNQAFNTLMSTDGLNPETSYIVWSILSNGNLAYVEQTLGQVLIRYPNHAGAHHYLLHIGEMKNDMTTAVYHAEILIGLSPDSAHAQHMYGHVLPQSGQWQKALDMFLIADNIHQKWSQKNQVGLEEDWHYAHNLDLMAAAYLGLGNDTKALDTWVTSMPYDQRAVPKAIGVAMAMGDLDFANQILTSYENADASWRNFLKPLRVEHTMLSNPAGTYAVSGTPGSYNYLVRLAVESRANPSLQSGLINSSRQYFTARLKAGGFDGWSNGFVELLRIRALAVAFNAPQAVTALDEIGAQAKAGTL